MSVQYSRHLQLNNLATCPCLGQSFKSSLFLDSCHLTLIPPGRTKQVTDKVDKTLVLNSHNFLTSPALDLFSY